MTVCTSSFMTGNLDPADEALLEEEALPQPESKRWGPFKFLASMSLGWSCDHCVLYEKQQCTLNLYTYVCLCVALIQVKYRRSGNFPVKNYSCVKRLCLKIFRGRH